MEKHNFMKFMSFTANVSSLTFSRTQSVDRFEGFLSLKSDEAGDAAATGVFSHCVVKKYL